MARSLVVVSVAAPVLVGGATLVLVAKALAGSWFWRLVVFGWFLVGSTWRCVRCALGTHAPRASRRVHGVVGPRDGVSVRRMGAETGPGRKGGVTWPSVREGRLSGVKLTCRDWTTPWER